jgi:TonB family protein
MKLIILGVIFICTVCQTAAQRIVPQTPEGCDFSIYRPIRMKHFPTEAVISKVSPQYPRKARTQKIEGKVSVKILINEAGIVEKACAFDGQKIFWAEAEKAALQWKFKPKYGLAFTTQRQDKAQKRYAFAYMVFTFKLSEQIKN